MSGEIEPNYLVNALSDPAIVLIQGKASYHNCAPVGKLLDHLIASGKQSIAMDFRNCTGMDSTFLGIIAGAALQIRKRVPPGNILLCRLGERNLELVRNLGIHRILQVDSGDFPMGFDDNGVSSLTELEKEGMANANLILKAHENLVQANKSNYSKFQDVLAFLKNQD